MRKRAMINKKQRSLNSKIVLLGIIIHLVETTLSNKGSKKLIILNQI